MQNDFELNIDAPSNGHLQYVLGKDDFDYIESRIVHMRYERSVNTGLSLSASRIYEAGRTMMSAIKTLSDVLKFKSIHLYGSFLDDQMMCTAIPYQFNLTNLRDVPYRARSIKSDGNWGYLHDLYGGKDPDVKLIQLYQNHNEIGQATFIVTVKSETGTDEYVYKVGKTGILAYDMTYRSPIEFKTQMLNSVYIRSQLPE